MEKQKYVHIKLNDRQQRNIRYKIIDRSYLFPYHKIKGKKNHFVCHPFKMNEKSRTNNPAFIFTIKRPSSSKVIHSSKTEKRSSRTKLLD